MATMIIKFGNSNDLTVNEGFASIVTVELERLMPNRTYEFYDLFSSYVAYELWCRNPKMNVYGELEGAECFVFLPELSGNTWDMETLAKNEKMRDLLFMDCYLNS